MTTTDLDLYNASDLTGRMHYAVQIAKAGSLLPKGVREGVSPTDHQAIAARTFLQMETGSMLGLHPIAALQGINVIEGQPSLKPVLMAALVLEAGHKLRKTETGTVEGGDYACTVQLTREGEAEVTASATWTPHRAARAGLCQYAQDGAVWKVTALSQRGSALPWQSYTEALCYARALSEACRAGAPDVLYGIGYTPEELGAQVDGQGNPIDGGEATVEQASAPASQPKRRAPAKGRQGTRRPTPEPEVAADDAAVAEHAEVVEGEAIETEQPQQPETEAHTVEPEPEPADEVPMYAAQVEVQPGSGTRVEQGADGIPVLYAEDVPPADGPTDDGETPPEDDYQLESPEVVDSRTGTVYPTQAAMDAALRAEREQRQAEREQAPAEPAPAGATTDWKAKLEAATTVAQVREVWDGAHLDRSITSELKAAIVARKTELERKAAEAAKA